MREVTLNEICKQKVIAIVRGLNKDEAVKAAKALYEGGIKLVEITFNQKAPETFVDTAETIKAIKEEMGDKMLVGAGTVTSPELVRLAAEAGALYIISPDTDVEVIRTTKELGLVSIPGAYTPTEAKQAYNAGADFVKLFPCVGNAPAYVKAVCGPFNHIKFLAVGGVNADNAADFLKAGAVGVGVGGNLVNKDWIKAGEYEKVRDEAAKYVRNLNA